MNSSSIKTASIHDLLPNHNEECFVIKNIFSKSECEIILSDAKKYGFQAASNKYPKSYRNNERIQFDDSKLADFFYNRIEQAIPQALETEAKCYRDASLNSRLRYCKYSQNQQFSIHQDGTYHDSKRRESVLTFLLYLNDAREYEGGKTTFYSDQRGKIRIAEYLGSVGDVIIFDHKLWHSGQSVLSGEKYILRSDLIYTVTSSKTKHIPHHDGYIWKVVKLPNNLIASASRDKSIRIWSKSLKLHQTLIGHSNSVFDLAYLRDLLFSVSRDGSLNIWKYSSNGYELKSEVKTLHESALSVCTSKKSIVTTGADGHVRVWDLSGNLLSDIRISDGWVWKALFLNGNQILTFSSEGEIKMIDIQKSQITREVRIPFTIRCATSIGNKIFVGDEQGAIHMLNTNDLGFVKSWLVHSGIVRDITHFNRKILSCGEDGRLVISNFHTNKILEIAAKESFMTSICRLNHDTVLSSSYSGQINIHTVIN